eukprot:NODE_2553_length_546_cov_58.167064_g2503_i0.p1 GENE.NODE_2553_length_546_cov_58.167064_g2503_i0~~NODE_2553_length_546_cov_58.167064_g2503_i0.p1  ORF type:complete len:122 (+),score=24.87 NODE_2553_length_546_cov_58.167064_g2503_i0:79-444(+)
MAHKPDWREGEQRLIAIIADEDTVTGFLLAGIGNLDRQGKQNFLIVGDKTELGEIEAAFKDFTSRSDVGILLVTSQVAEDIRYLMNDYKKTIPTVLEIYSDNESKARDPVLVRINQMFGDS